MNREAIKETIAKDAKEVARLRAMAKYYWETANRLEKGIESFKELINQSQTIK